MLADRARREVAVLAPRVEIAFHAGAGLRECERSAGAFGCRHGKIKQMELTGIDFAEETAGLG